MYDGISLLKWNNDDLIIVLGYHGWIFEWNNKV